jgi:hypothetical protein
MTPLEAWGFLIALTVLAIVLALSAAERRRIFMTFATAVRRRNVIVHGMEESVEEGIRSVKITGIADGRPFVFTGLTNAETGRRAHLLEIPDPTSHRAPCWSWGADASGSRDDEATLRELFDHLLIESARQP